MSVVFQHVGHFDIEREIGRGGMATVFLATDTRTNRRVALKLVPAGRDQEAREILEAEHWGARLQSEFSRASRHVPAVYEHGTEGSYFYIAMEYLEGRNLSEVMAAGPLIPPRAVAIAIQLCEFLEAAHGFRTTLDGRDLRSLLHGDLKPRNIRVLDDDEIKVLDFGIAKALSLSRRVTRNDFGSIAYLSPERLESGEIDEHADLWAVGVLLYEMLSGVQPFTGDDTRRLEQRIRSRRPPKRLDDRCPASLQAVLAKLLAPNQQDRYSTAQAVREDLSAFAAGRQTQAEIETSNRPSDVEATRRTSPPALPGTPPAVPPPPSSDDATRRTVRPLGDTVPLKTAAAPAGSGVAPPPALLPAAGGGTAAPSSAAAPVAGVKKPKAKRRFYRRAWFIAAMFLAVNEIWVGTRADQLVGRVPHQELDTINEMWEEYDALADRSLNMGLSGLEDALLRQTQLLTDRVADNYKSPAPTVREAHWQLARASLARAVSVRPNSNRLRGSLRYAQGHLHRINGEARKSRQQLDEAQRDFTNAVAAFREAAEFRPSWPDPFIGLTRTFIYGLDDVDRGAEALKEAERLGYAPGERERSLLADSYRTRGDALARMARQQQDREREKEYLTRAAESYRQAISAYGALVGISAADRGMRAAQRSLNRVEDRLEALDHPVALSLEDLFRWP